MMLTKKNPDKIATAVARYFQQSFGVDVEPGPAVNPAQWPLYFQETYAIAQVIVNSVPCLLLAPLDPDSLSPAMARKHLDRVGENAQTEAFLVLEEVSPILRKRLVDAKCSFVVPGKQVYLPFLGIIFREEKRKRRRKISNGFSPSTQVVLLYAILHKRNEFDSALQLSAELGYSNMTIGRAFADLEKAGLGERTKVGKERRFQFLLTGRELWEQAQPMLVTPVKKRVIMPASIRPENTRIAGFTALTTLTMIADSQMPTSAMHHAEYMRQCPYWNDELDPDLGPNAQEMEIWTYDPCILSTGPLVDPLSLVLSIDAENDERVEMAKEQVLEKLQW